MLPGGNYNLFLANNFNYVQGLRNFLLNTSSVGLQLLGYQTKTNSYSLLAIGYHKINLAYDCLGFGVMSFIAALTITYPSKTKAKLLLFVLLTIGFQLLNVLRFMLLALYWPGKAGNQINHHTVFNLLIYLLLAVILYYWIDKSTLKKVSNL
ncbi:MAG: exosortase/archaeosortase family protein [Sphingobacteriaceae bacterium]|nr:MAG: exosortase/archaeosortase family protein [Sphingobacteriaceae bacterium]